MRNHDPSNGEAVLGGKAHIPLYIFFVLFVQVGIGYAAEFQAKVVHVADGDTITVLTSTKEQVKIRLNGIDCPEKKQAYGNKATAFTKALVALQIVTIQSFGQDRYGRTIADVVLEDGRNLNHELVKAGYAWWFFKYSNDEQLGMLEVQAKITKVGLWKDKNPIPPWIFRHRNKLADLPARGPPEVTPEVTPPSTPCSSLPIYGNRRSQKYHRPDCPSYCQIAPKNRVPFDSAQAAEDAGYTLAGNCP